MQFTDLRPGSAGVKPSEVVVDGGTVVGMVVDAGLQAFKVIVGNKAGSLLAIAAVIARVAPVASARHAVSAALIV